MRHRKKLNHLGRKSQHRKAMLANMAASLILHKRIYTTVAKAKALKVYVEPLITKAKEDSTHSRRVVFSYLGNKYAVTELFREVSLKVADRPGGYTRILKIGFRAGDSAEMCMIELVDYNPNLTSKSASDQGKKTRRAGRRKKSDAATGVAGATLAKTTKEEPTTSEMVAQGDEPHEVAAETEEVAVIEKIEAEVEETPIAQAESPVEESEVEEKPADVDEAPEVAAETEEVAVTGEKEAEVEETPLAQAETPVEESEVEEKPADVDEAPEVAAKPEKVGKTEDKETVSSETETPEKETSEDQKEDSATGKKE